MSGRGISKLGLPPMQYRVDLHFPNFENYEDCQLEDVLRAMNMYNAIQVGHLEGSPSNMILMENLDEIGVDGCFYPTLASSTYMRKLRIQVCGAIWELMEDSGVENVAAFTIIPATWEFGQSEFKDPSKVRAGNLIKALRAALISLDADMSNGWIIAFIHGEHEPISGVFRLHVHGFACGGMIDVVDRLRRLRNYQTCEWTSDGMPNPVYRRVHISRKPITNLPRAATYALQSFWPARALLIFEDDRIRARRKSRIGEPFHSYLLKWLDQQRLENLTLMMGLRVTKGGLKQTKPVS